MVAVGTSLAAVVGIASIAQRAESRSFGMGRQRRWLTRGIGIVHFAAGSIVAALLAFFLVAAFWSMRGLVVEPARLIVEESRRIDDKAKVLVMACLATSVAAASIWLVVRRINRLDDPQAAPLPDDSNDAC
ncbi:MAG: hypothetical protein ACT4QC_00245 [Planctomycetaceae bacterium]